MEIRKLTDAEREALLHAALARDPLRAWLADARPGDVFRVTLDEGDAWERLQRAIGRAARQARFGVVWLRDVGDATTRYVEVTEYKPRPRAVAPQAKLPPPPDPTVAPVAAPKPEPATKPHVAAPPDNPLSRREQQVLGMIAADRGYREIADQLGVSKSTVGVLCYHIREKLGVGSTAQAIAVACARGWLDETTVASEELPPLRRQYLEWAKPQSEEAS